MWSLAFWLPLRYRVKKRKEKKDLVIVFHRCRSLNSNKFSGSIPASLGRLSNLYWFDLADNKLSGGLPVFDGTNPGLDNLTNTKHLYVPVLVPRIKFIDIILGSDILIPLKSCGSFDGRFFAATSGSISSQEQYRARFSTQIWRWYMCKWEETHTTFGRFLLWRLAQACVLYVCRLLDNNNFTGRIPPTLGLLNTLEVMWVQYLHGMAWKRKSTDFFLFLFFH